MNWNLLGLGVAAVLAAAAPAFAKCDANEPTPTPTPNSRYVLKGGEVLDTKTKLTWQRCSVGQKWQEGKGCTGSVATMPWADAAKKAGDGWRLPTEAELLTLSTPTCVPPSMPNYGDPAINDEVFPDLDKTKRAYWVSDEFGPYYYRVVNFSDFEVRYAQYGMRKFAVRLVKSGQ